MNFLTTLPIFLIRARHIVCVLMMLQVLPVLAQSNAAPAAPPAAAPETKKENVPTFNLFEFEIDGNTVLDPSIIEKTVDPFLGGGKTFEDVEAARVALEKAYRDAGFGTVLVDIPPQKVKDGVVRLQVTEGGVSKLSILGAKYYSQEKIIEKVPGLAPGQVPNFTEVQKQLGTVNRSQDRIVTPIFRPGKKEGTTEVDLAVQDQLPVHGSVELNNRYTAHTTHPRLTGSLRYDNLFQREHSLSLTYQMSPNRLDDMKVWVASYAIPMEDQYLVMSAIKSNSTSPTGITGSNVFGKGNIFSVRDIIQIDQDIDLKMSQSLTLGVDYKDLDEALFFGSTDPTLTPVRYLPITLDYQGIKDDANGRWQWGGGFTSAFGRFFSEDSQFDDKRFKGRSSFFAFRFNFSRLEKLSKDYALFAKVDGQLSGQPLIASELFMVGGAESVRGYLESSAGGDSGVHGTLELRSPNLLTGNHPWLKSVSWQAFIDAASVKINDPLPQQSGSHQLWSAGVGLRLNAQKQFSLSLDLARPMRDTVNTKAGDVFLHARGLFEF